MTVIKGSCLCGAVRYKIDADPLGQAVCHCRNCQRQSGSAFSVLLAVPKVAFSLQGSDRLFEDAGDSGATVERHFCPTCGSPIYTTLPASPEVLYVKAGTLDDPSIMKPRVHVWCDSAWASTEFPERVIKIPKNPTSTPR